MIPRTNSRLFPPMEARFLEGTDIPKLINTVDFVQSPSLTASAASDLRAYELKFLLTRAQAQEVVERTAGRLIPDPHGDPGRGCSYETTSLYFDTAQFDVFHRVGSCKRRKHRLRRYGGADSIFLERKTKWGDRVKKHRTKVPVADLALLAAPLSAPSWPGHWFHQQRERRRLVPACRITYERIALVGRSSEGPMRLTFDRRLRGVLTNEWNVGTVDGGMPLLTGRVLCEFKYCTFLPALFKEIIQDMRLTPSPVSKYRALLRASGMIENGRSVDVRVA